MSAKRREVRPPICLRGHDPKSGPLPTSRAISPIDSYAKNRRSGEFATKSGDRLPVLAHSLPGEHDRNRTPVLDHLPGRRQLAGATVNTECDHGVTLFVRRVKKTPGWIETDEAWAAALRWLPADHAQQPFRIGGEDSDAVVAAVGAINETAVRRDCDLGCGAVAGEVCRQRRHHLERLERAAFGVELVGRDRAV